VKILLFLAFLSFGISVSAKTLVIADIDDTLKNAHILDTDDMMVRSIETKDVFLGMNWAFQGLKTAQPETAFYYVSAAIEDLMWDLHKGFLKDNQFPKGQLILRKEYFGGDDFKILTIREILKKTKPDLVISVGDNGQKDVEVYEQIRREFPQIRFVTFIHQVYSSRAGDEQGTALASGQIGFATSLDLFLTWHSLNLVPQSQVRVFLSTFAPVYLNENPARDLLRMAIPAWMDCRDYQWSVNDSVFADMPELVEVKNKISQRCSVPAYQED
jgi:hypothetical protein